MNSQFSIRVATSSDENIYLKLTDVEGRLISEQKITAAEEIYSAEKLSAGIYFAEVKQGDNSKVIRVIKTE